MDSLPTVPPLAEILARRLDAVRRMGGQCRRPRERNRQRRVDEVIAQARAAIASGEPAAVGAALSAVDLVFFELCED
jgi:hypothetical protein